MLYLLFLQQFHVMQFRIAHFTNITVKGMYAKKSTAFFILVNPSPESKIHSQTKNSENIEKSVLNVR